MGESEMKIERDREREREKMSGRRWVFLSLNAVSAVSFPSPMVGLRFFAEGDLPFYASDGSGGGS